MSVHIYTVRNKLEEFTKCPIHYVAFLSLYRYSTDIFGCLFASIHAGYL